MGGGVEPPPPPPPRSASAVLLHDSWPSESYLFHPSVTVWKKVSTEGHSNGQRGTDTHGHRDAGRADKGGGSTD